MELFPPLSHQSEDICQTDSFSPWIIHCGLTFGFEIDVPKKAYHHHKKHFSNKCQWHGQLKD